MKKNTYYLIVGCIAILLVFVIWYSDLIHMSMLIVVSFIAAVALLYFLRRYVTDLIEDERDRKINEQAMVRTMQVFWVVFCAFSIGAVLQMLRVPTLPPGFGRIPPPPGNEPSPIPTPGSVPQGGPGEMPMAVPDTNHTGIKDTLPDLLSPRMIGYIQLGLLCLMIFLYVGFRIYYERKYGGWETDEE